MFSVIYEWDPASGEYTPEWAEIDDEEFMPKSMKGVFEEFETGKLHSGSKSGPVVSNRKQAIAIGLSEQRKRSESVPGLMATRNNLRNHRQASIAHIKRGSR